MFLKDFYTHLTTSAGLSAADICPHVLSENNTAGGITFLLENHERDVELNGEVNYHKASVEIDCWHQDFPTALDWAEEIETAYTNFEGELVSGGVDVDTLRFDNQFTDFETETGLYRVTFLLSITYRNP